MAPYPIISNTFRAAFNWIHDDNPGTATNVMHFAKSGGSSATLWTALDTNATAAMWKFQPTHAHIDNVVIIPLDGGTAALTTATGRPSKWSGVSTDQNFIPQVSNIVKLTTARRGRSYRGRIFLPFVSESYGTDGVLTAANVAICTAAWVAFNAAMTAGGWNPVVASYIHSTSENVVAMRCEANLATQRRRMKRTSA